MPKVNPPGCAQVKRKTRTFAGAEIKACARVAHLAHPEFHMVDGRIQVEPAPVGVGRSSLVKFEVEIAKRQVTLRIRTLHLPDEPVGQFIVTGEQRFAHFGQDGLGCGVGVVTRVARPQRFFVELHVFDRRAAENHRAKTAVAERQGFAPVIRRLCIPEHILVTHVCFVPLLLIQPHPRCVPAASRAVLWAAKITPLTGNP